MFVTRPVVCSPDAGSHRRQFADNPLDDGIVLLDDEMVGQRLGWFGIASYAAQPSAFNRTAATACIAPAASMTCSSGWHEGPTRCGFRTWATPFGTASGGMFAPGCPASLLGAASVASRARAALRASTVRPSSFRRDDLEQTVRTVADLATFIVDAKGETFTVEVSSAAFARPELGVLLDGLKLVREQDYPIRGRAQPRRRADTQPLSA